MIQVIAGRPRYFEQTFWRSRGFVYVVSAQRLELTLLWGLGQLDVTSCNGVHAREVLSAGIVAHNHDSKIVGWFVVVVVVVVVVVAVVVVVFVGQG